MPRALNANRISSRLKNTKTCHSERSLRSEESLFYSHLFAMLLRT